MTPPERSRDGPPIFACRLCSEAITSAVDAVVFASGVAHALCVDPGPTAPLTPDERSRLIRTCRNHTVAKCPVCSRTYRIIEMGTDLSSDRYHLCPTCRVDLTRSIRQHIADCSVIRLNDPWWQADTREALTRAHATRKASQQLRDASELARIESEVLLRKLRDAADAARLTKEESERIKREWPGGSGSERRFERAASDDAGSDNDVFMADVPTAHVPPFRCMLCAEAIQTPEQLVMIGLAVVHGACLERSGVSELARIENKLQSDSAIEYRRHRLEPQSYLNEESRRWVPRVFILRDARGVNLSAPDHPWEMLTAHDDEQDTLGAADDYALALGRRWVDGNA